MPHSQTLILGEAVRKLDERYRIALPSTLSQPLAAESSDCVIAKEQPGCLSLWNAAVWHARQEANLQVIQTKLLAGRLDRQLGELQQLGRLLSTRHVSTPITGRNRILVPDGFRQFLGVDRGEDVVLLGAAVCVEFWNPAQLHTHVGEEMPRFQQLFERLID